MILPQPAQYKDLKEWAEKLTVALEEVLAPAVPIILPGTVVLWASDIDLQGYLLCNGDEYNIEDYPALARVLGDLHGVAAVGKFLVPALTPPADTFYWIKT